MKNLSNEDKKKVEVSMQEIFADFSDRVNQMQNKQRELEQKMNVFQPRLLNYLKTVCKKEFEWIEENSKYTEGGDMKIDVEPGKHEEIEKKFLEFEQCAAENDHGIKEYFGNVEMENIAKQKESDNCVSNCMNEIQLKSQKDVYNCMKPCLVNFFEYSEKTLKITSEKIDEFSKLI